jgi:hypothetical protein
MPWVLLFHTRSIKMQVPFDPFFDLRDMIYATIIKNHKAMLQAKKSNL